MTAIQEELMPLSVVVPASDENGIEGGYFLSLTHAELAAGKALDEDPLVLPLGSKFQVQSMASDSAWHGLKQKFLRRRGFKD